MPIPELPMTGCKYHLPTPGWLVCPHIEEWVLAYPIPENRPELYVTYPTAKRFGRLMCPECDALAETALNAPAILPHLWVLGGHLSERSREQMGAIEQIQKIPMTVFCGKCGPILYKYRYNLPIVTHPLHA